MCAVRGTGNWQRAAAVLFERHSLSGHPAPSRPSRERTAGSVAPGVDSGRWWDGGDVAATITTKSDDQRMPDKANAQLVMQPLAFKVRGGCEGGGKGYLGSDDAAFTVATTQDQWLAQVISFGAQMSEPQTDTDIVQTLQAKNPMAVAQPVAFVDVGATLKGGSGSRGYPDPSDGNGHNIVAQPVAFTRCDNGQDAAVDVTPTMRCGSNYSAHLAVAQPAMQVRRLTPVECERLQGFPDGYTNIPWRGKPESPDGPRYKALGNSMAVPVMRYIGERISKVAQL